MNVGGFFYDVCPDVLRDGANLNLEPKCIFAQNYVDRTVTVRRLLSAVDHRGGGAEAATKKIKCGILLTEVIDDDAAAIDVLHLRKLSCLAP